MHTLAAKNICKIYNGRRVVNDISLQLKAGEVVGLLGPNGAGKTTTFYMCVGLIAPNQGQILIDEKDITKEPVFERARLGIGYLPQEASVFRKLSVRDNVMSILETVPFPSERERKKRLAELLDDLGVTALANNIAASLSGGERRRVEIARALARSPHFILLDEPFAGIDPIAIADIQSIVRKLKEKEIGVLITDHNVRETLGICERAYIVVDGNILVEGTPEEITQSEAAQHYYLGENFAL